LITIEHQLVKDFNLMEIM